jgi:DNA processing protein
MRLLLNYFESAQAAWHASRTDLLAAGLDPKSTAALIETRHKIDLDAEMARIEAARAVVLTWESEQYPERLRVLDDAPPVLYMLGELTDSDSWAVAVVGTRRATSYGREATTRLVAGLVENRVTVVSGLAKGIDTTAQTAALEAGGRTLAVLGSGVDVIYPPENRPLAWRILKEGAGAILSEYPPGTEPEPLNFPPRNRIISGLALGVVVVEADLKSGALITVKFALEQGREVFAVPGPITSRMSEGTNGLIKQGAKCVTTVEDILEELNIQSVSEHVHAARELPADPVERVLLELLRESSQHIDELTNKSGLPASTVSAVLTMMELKGWVQHLGQMQYAAR